MRQVSESDIDLLASLYERAAKQLRASGKEAVRRARDWATPLRSAGTDPGRGKGQVSDPTFAAATSFDPNAEELAYLSSEAGRAFDAVTTLESRVSRIATDAVVENQRLGVGSCAECTRYIDGTNGQRLRLGLCEACYKRANRKERDCPHTKQRWHDGVIRCMNPACNAALTAAGVPIS